ncbi:MAG: hypothetical protein V2A67_07215 [Bacteroidota bacterium]
MMQFKQFFRKGILIMILGAGFLQAACENGMLAGIKATPWKVRAGYEYLLMLQPDTCRGHFRELDICFDRKVAPGLWFGTGFSAGRVELDEYAKYWVTNWKIYDSLGIRSLRDSMTFEQRWQKHIAVPFRITYNLFRNQEFALPVNFDVMFGGIVNQGHYYEYDHTGQGGYGQKLDGFTGFITLGMGLGYEFFYHGILSATLSADYRHMIAGPKSFGYGQDFIGGRILINLDFSSVSPH